jgi:hypothetical protein
MLKKQKKPPHLSLAEKAAREIAPKNGVGKFIGAVDEQDHVVSYRLEAKVEGYVGWEWNVVIFQSKKSATPTVSEVVLIPGENALVAPEWVPWSDRRAEIEKTNLEELALPDFPEPKKTKSDSKKTAKRPPLRERLRKALIKNKNDN